MSEKESKTFLEKLSEVEEKNRLGSMQLGEDTITSYMGMTATDFSNMDRKGLTSAAFSLSRFGLHIADQCSRATALAAAAERWLTRELHGVADNYKGFTVEERKFKALNDNSYFKEVHDQIIENEMIAKRLHALSFRIDDLVKRIEGFVRATYKGRDE